MPLDEIPQCGQYWEWEHPPGMPQGEHDAGLIHTGVGAALSAWEHMEWAVADVFSAFMEANRDASERVYGALEGLKVKMEVLEQAAQAAFRQRDVAPEFREAWKRLKGHYSLAHNRRNEIAHGQVVHARAAGAIGQATNYLLMPRANAKKSSPVWESPPDAPLSTIGYRYSAADIKRWTDQFWQLDSWVRLFEEEYSAKYPRR